MKAILLLATLAIAGCTTGADWRTVEQSPRVREGIHKKHGGPTASEAAGAESQSREGFENPFLYPEGPPLPQPDVTATNYNERAIRP